MFNLYSAAVGVLCLSALPALAQTSTPAPQGLEAPWDVRKLASDLERDLTQSQMLLTQINPQTWVDTKGAPSTYIVQQQAAQQQVKDAITVCKLFSQRPESLTTGLDTYFRLEALEFSERGLIEGARQFDVRANAEKLDASMAHNFDTRQRLRQYLVSLASTTEENFKIADSEAQRCRSTLSRQPSALGMKKR